MQGNPVSSQELKFFWQEGGGFLLFERKGEFACTQVNLTFSLSTTTYSFKHISGHVGDGASVFLCKKVHTNNCVQQLSDYCGTANINVQFTPLKTRCLGSKV